jgi:hypothetical protein
MDRNEYNSKVNELVGDGVPVEEAHYMVAKKLSEVANTKYHKVASIWPPKSHSNKVAYEGRTEEEVKIPKGAKILLFFNDSSNENAPKYRIVWTW